jgi:hypothetical protein
MICLHFPEPQMTLIENRCTPQDLAGGGWLLPARDLGEFTQRAEKRELSGLVNRAGKT